MQLTKFGRHSKEYISSVWNYAKRLEAETITIHKDGTIDLFCSDGCICENYRPTAKELYK